MMTREPQFIYFISLLYELNNIVENYILLFIKLILVRSILEKTKHLIDDL